MPGEGPVRFCVGQAEPGPCGALMSLAVDGLLPGYLEKVSLPFFVGTPLLVNSLGASPAFCLGGPLMLLGVCMFLI